MDRRKNERHSVTGPVWFHWTDAVGAGRDDTGLLRNLSAVGLFVETEKDPPPVGTDLEIRFEFNSEKPAVSVKTKGQVTRIQSIDGSGNTIGFAASTSRMKLQKALDEDRPLKLDLR